MTRPPDSTPTSAEPVPMGAAPMPLLANPAPLAERDRIVAIDALRGFAVLGILVMNIQSFAMPGAAYMNPTAYGDLEGANYWAWYLSHLLADQKFMTIFSMLFGAGIILMTSRIEATGRGSAGLHYRRMGWLILFGLLHAHLLWYGDILYFYGMCGLVAWLFRKLPAWVLIPGGLAVVSVASLISIAGGWSVGFWEQADFAKFELQLKPPPDAIQHEIDAYRGSWLEQLPNRSASALVFETFMFAIWGSWRAGGLMLVGMGLYKLGIFSGRARTPTYIAMAIAGLAIGIPVVMFGIHANEAHNWEATYAIFTGSQYNYWASIPISLGYVGIVMLLHRRGALGWLMRALEAVGQMALTNYLLQTAICTSIFYGHGLGYFGALDRTHQIAIVFSIWAFQLVVSPLWLKHFQYGPAEWFWRTLTYMRTQPLRKVQPVTGLAATSEAG